MKIIHCADIHIGSALENVGADKSGTRKREIIDTFLRMIDFAKREQVKAVIIAGDLFDGRKVSKSIRGEILDKFKKCPEVDFIYVRGNHDKATEFTDEQEFLAPTNLKLVAGKDWESYEYENIVITAADMQKQSGNSIYEKLKLDKDKFNIVVLHGDLDAINIGRLRGKNIDFLALGDRHIPDLQKQKLDSRGDYGYSGCLEGRGFDETDERGFFLLEITDKGMNRKFHPFAKRQYKLAKVDITDCDNHSAIYEKILGQTDKFNKDHLVKVELTGKFKANINKDVDGIARKLNDVFFYAKIKDKSQLDRGSVNYGNEVSLRAEFVKLVSESKELTQEEKDRIIEFGIKALQGEEVDLCS